MNDQQAKSNPDSEPTEPAPAATPPESATPVRTAVRELLDRLRSENRVFRERLPMAIGIHRQLASSTGASAVVVRRVCALQSGSIAYLRHLCAGGPRYDLDGNVSGEVTPEQITAAQQYLAKVLARKAETDARSGRAKAGAEQFRPPRAQRSTQKPPQDPAATPKAADPSAGASAKQSDVSRPPRPPSAEPRAARSAPASRPPAEKTRWQRPQRERSTQPARQPSDARNPTRAPASGTPPPKVEPRPTSKADPQSQTASAMALALSAALKSAPADFVPRAAPAPAATPASKASAPHERRGRGGAGRGGSHSPKR